MDIETFIYEGQICKLKDYKFIVWNNKNYEINVLEEMLDEPGILIYPSNQDLLSFIVYNNILEIYKPNNFNCIESFIQSVNIEYLLNEQMLNLDLLMPYLENIISMHENIKIETEELFKQGKQTKRAN